ncbi:Substrate-specific component NikM of nickel ECF transporter [Candidatus Terasakiella magnetica]|uniref:Substrate-specific component NikM of nickel ECF transporter n=1 Tax=Candidatus Terasakiella magnetica TaxID=1867952 RepID=A0A1C3RDZ8_9PROT|nr:cobalt transporter CbiM [Candidatus Terasakiella magnetica]SCA55520.1 Substrate-specific component NikM of nickel ECF transporter [Candidatus Terasakiella magnetica]
MHIVDGALSNDVVIAGGVLAVAGMAIGLKKMDMEKIPAAGVMAATFFVASLIHVPLGPSSVHLIMNGLAGIILGWTAFPALFVGLLLQAIFFGYGGVTVLGINTVAIALPAVLMHFICKNGIHSPTKKIAMFWGGLAGAGSIALTAVLVTLALAITGEAFIPAAKLIILAHLPVMAIEGFLCACAVALIHRVKPELFDTFAPTPKEVSHA